MTNLGCGYGDSVCCPLVVNVGSNINSGKMVDGQRCGLSQVQGNNYNGIGAFPWAVRIGFRSNTKLLHFFLIVNKYFFLDTANGEIKYPCTGSIISNRIILTAAHCALAKADNYKL